jgi:hypothetical protein
MQTITVRVDNDKKADALYTLLREMPEVQVNRSAGLPEVDVGALGEWEGLTKPGEKLTFKKFDKATNTWKVWQ